MLSENISNHFINHTFEHMNIYNETNYLEKANSNELTDNLIEEISTINNIENNDDTMAHKENSRMTLNLGYDNNDETIGTDFTDLIDYSTNRILNDSDSLTSVQLEDELNEHSNIDIREVQDESMGKLKIDETTRTKIFHDYFTTVNKTESKLQPDKDSRNDFNETINENLNQTDKVLIQVGLNGSETFFNNSLLRPDTLVPPITGILQSTRPEFNEG